MNMFKNLSEIQIFSSQKHRHSCQSSGCQAFMASRHAITMRIAMQILRRPCDEGHKTSEYKLQKEVENFAYIPGAREWFLRCIMRGL